MSMFAVIQTGGKQYKVKEGDTLEVEKLLGEKGDSVSIAEVLLVGEEDGSNVSVGAPHVSGASVTAEIVEQGRGEKTTAMKYKRKVRYRKHLGHRQAFTALKITKIA